MTDGTKITTTDYLGGFQYKNNDLQFFPTSEGYVNVVTNKVSGGRTYNYVYNYTDHLGNVRVSYAWDDTESKLKILEENHYYPFGLKHTGYNDLTLGVEIVNSSDVRVGIGVVNMQISGSDSYNYKYNGKELQTDLDINLYDYGARNYDPSIGRFYNLDILSEKYEAISPYGYVANNPVRFVDVDGEYIYIYDSSTGSNYRYENGQLQSYDSKERKYVNADTSKLSSEAQALVGALNDLYASGDTGKGLIDFFGGKDYDVVFLQGNKNVNGVRGDLSASGAVQIAYNSIYPGLSTELGSDLVYSPFYTVIGHEMGHAQSRVLQNKDSNTTWLNGLPPTLLDEIWASHIENKIRAESGKPLRTFYSDNTDSSLLNRNPTTNVFDGTARFIDSKESYPRMGTVQAIMNGSVTLENRFDYSKK